MSADAASRQFEPLLKTEEVAELFKVDPETVRVWARTGKIQARKNPGGHEYRFRASDLEELLSSPDLACD
ncbi:helix-turn-helix domain-containing protein [Nonomuraea sp. NPDC050310]|uniref:helix-turn-helix domain-containing protein n=1 Tax=Nonomuraea sp. NPDC050310 TaxID=3154935 RepID=UPI0033CEA1CB